MMPHSLTRQRLSKVHRRITRPRTGQDLMPGEDRAQGETGGEVGRSGGGTIIALEWTRTAHRLRIGGLVLVLQTPLVCKGRLISFYFNFYFIKYFTSTLYISLLFTRLQYY